MFARTKQCKLSKMLRLNNFLFAFSLRQGTILIAAHQITLFSFVLIILLICLTHVGKVLTLLHDDMEDDAERRGFYEVNYRNQMTFHEGDVISTNNQRRFAKAQHLASVTVIILYTSTILASIYLMCCISLLHGAIKYKREYMLPWVIASCVSITPFMAAMILGDSYPNIVDIYGGHNYYRFICVFLMLTFLYAFWAVCSFVLETGESRCARAMLANDERGERLLLLDHAAHSSLLSAAQLNKLSHGTRTHFV
ncbi:uncharacterized protein [Epargyreus clarus]|uniref:uncharacterized protein n=1 Tax=Epargyreus clarus TaxID=520877 RepID=UPI003C2F6EFE